jgi:WD40 repeat protein
MYRPFRIIQATYEGELRSISVRNDGKSVTVSDDSGEIKIFNFDDGKLLRLTNNGHATSVTSVAESPDNKKLISGDLQGGLMIWDIDF